MNKFKRHENFINRELSWIEFNKRVLEECRNTNHPLFERLRFIAITSSNLDEFFMVRVGSLLDQIKVGFTKTDPSGMTPKQQLSEICKSTAKLVNSQCNYFNRSLKIALGRENINFLTIKDLNREQLDYIHDYYYKNIFPVITPMLIDRSTSFPLILNKSLNIGLIIEENDEKTFATVEVPSVLDRIIKIPSDSGLNIIMLEDILKLNLSSLFGTSKILASGCYRITRNADLTLDEEGAEDLLEAIEESIKQRKWGAAVRLEVEHGMDSDILSILEKELEITKEQEYKINTPLDLSFLNKLINNKEYERLCYKPIKPYNPLKYIDDEDIFDTISKKDILLQHPYESFDPIVNLVRQSAKDPSVLAIKQTLYRVSGNSPIIKALIAAVENKKQVTVLVELKARFDEENNINWAKQLEEAGCHVIYGLVGLKTHCKLLLIVRREKNGIKRYVHMGTGNYNDVTAKIYTDIGLLSSNPYYGEDASMIFNMLSGRSIPKDLKKLCIAPLNLRERFLYLIDQETKNAKIGKPAKIVAKMNSIVDKEIIQNLYKASSAGVKIQLIVRGICCLKPKIPQISDNITVISIVGRFLEHSRIFYFYNEGEELIYLSSADWMNRNLDRRVELLFPIENIEIKEKIKRTLRIYLKDTLGAKQLNNDGTYSRIDKRGKKPLDSQETFYQYSLIENDKHSSLEKTKISKTKWREEGFKVKQNQD
ncbi:RNA degradosome polyphosphate kinase [Clostridium tyrobutyricum]|jgi:polyphosphate kinase|uniref:Polyphosphate kinase n=1 Tax=Clostridium tyrobutyricum DIVETGP TaxID=1408889 RepID=W6N7G6_CLOTY|nr:RNA degradosome polyphosphate kinase [Clostridium tyrobutyricum]AND83465.1 polyphosphate kinase [Clostridium tyrobutyricum]ANP68262.1 RNA degradosome polyphosphate kinase [Clostridium tyrobutyricum]MBV4433224.1 RNA degradosome polyphosphate kinase [Clostridium tyrobutyricum]MCH4200431.1 RNA degradosome polyphosphate kinase [Clostridium tyrobutyricum]MCH4258403.1 RNA degradosome polyphosphate kinase [Clostridium tyrobutyricum]